MRTRFVSLGLALTFLAVSPATSFAGGQPAKMHKEDKTVSTAPAPCEAPAPGSPKLSDPAFTK